MKLFIDELNRTKADSKDSGDPPPPEAPAAGKTETKENRRPRGRQSLASHLKRHRVVHDRAKEESIAPKASRSSKALLWFWHGAPSDGIIYWKKFNDLTQPNQPPFYTQIAWETKP